MTTMGISSGTIVLTAVSGYIVEYYDWHTGFLILGVATSGCRRDAALVIVKKDISGSERASARTGMLNIARASEAKSPGDRPSTISRRDALRNPRVLVLGGSYSLAVMVLMSVFVHQVADALDHGIGKIAAASSIGIVSMAGFAGQFFFGWLSDRIADPKYASFLGFLLDGRGYRYPHQRRDATDAFPVLSGIRIRIRQSCAHGSPS